VNAFKDIFSAVDTDKVNPGHYEDGYEECFGGIRDEVKLLFEIGVNRGGSVRGWKQYFPNAVIVGLEINKDCWFADDRIQIEIGDATDKGFIEAVIFKYGKPDIVVDDGSHTSRDLKLSYGLLYHHTRICYVMEDVGVQYMSYMNGCFINDGVPAQTIVHAEMDELLQKRGVCKSIKVYGSICFMFKR